MPFIIITILLCVLLILGLYYLVTRIHRFSPFQRIAEKSRFLSWLAASIPLILAIIAFAFFPYEILIPALHLMAFFGVGDLIGFLIRKRREKSVRYDFIGGGVILFTTVYLAFGWFFAHHVFETAYMLETDKQLGADSVRVVMIADSHLGKIMSGTDFAEELERIQQTDPDLLLIAGDFVDDDSDRESMETACRALGTLKTTYGIYFTLGNHDKGYFNNRDFTEIDLRNALTENGVIILEDETARINDSFYLIGRKDRSYSDRLSIQALTEPLDQSRYMLVMDHQPNDYKNETEAQVDLVLSGHTHGGHVFPAGLIGLLIGANDKVYGYERREQTDFIVTSGISGWAIPFKTAAISEYVVIDITTGE